jgi:hypothetical protein
MQWEKGEGMRRRSEQARARRQARAQAQAQTLEVEWGKRILFVFWGDGKRFVF